MQKMCFDNLQTLYFQRKLYLDQIYARKLNTLSVMKEKTTLITDKLFYAER